jgi:hypothetical protein
MFRFLVVLCARARVLEDLLHFRFYIVNFRGAICRISTISAGN